MSCTLLSINTWRGHEGVTIDGGKGLHVVTSSFQRPTCQIWFTVFRFKALHVVLPLLLMEMFSNWNCSDSVGVSRNGFKSLKTFY